MGQVLKCIAASYYTTLITTLITVILEMYLKPLLLNEKQWESIFNPPEGAGLPK